MSAFGVSESLMMVSHELSNRYLVVPPWSAEPMVWNPCDASDLPVPDCAYIGEALAAVERDRSITGLTFVITSNVTTLPVYGRHVVVVLLSDEWCRVPRYAYSVGAIFKTYGIHLPINFGALRRPSMYELVALAQDVRTAIRRLPASIAALRSSLKAVAGGPRRAPIVTIPLGYFRQVDVPFVAIAERRYDVYFAGSVANSSGRVGLKALTPKTMSRSLMLRSLRDVQRRCPEFSITAAQTRGFHETTDDEAVRYSNDMMDTKVCLVPRGTSLETYRFFEGMRAGCVLVAERLPRHWFYTGAPVIRVRSWRELDRVLPPLLRDCEQLERLSRASLAFWNERCSGAAVGADMVRYIRSLVPSADVAAGAFAPP